MHTLTGAALARLLLAVAAACCATTAARAAIWDWQSASGARPDALGGIARVATGIDSSDALAPGGPLRLHTGDSEEWMFYMAIGRQLDMPEQLDLSFTARLVDMHGTSPLRSPLAVVANLVGGRGVTILITDGAVGLLRHDDQAFSSRFVLDTTVFHDYRLVVSGPQNGAPIDLYVDGVKRLRDNVSQGVLYTPHARIAFGDSSFVAGGSSEWLRFSHNAAAVPEPGAWALLLAGLAAVGGMARRRLHASRQAAPTYSV